jgi:hypothetical protein
MSLLIFVGCTVVLFIFLITYLGRVETVPLPEPSGAKPDYYRITLYETERFARQRARAEQRAAVYETCALLFGVAVAFFALKLFLAAVRGWDEEPGRAGTAWERLAPMVPALVALACATLIVVTAREVSPYAGEPEGGSVPSFRQPGAAQ